MHLAIVQHAPGEDLSSYDGALHGPGLTLTQIFPYRGDRFPPWTHFDRMIVLGGPMSVNDHAAYPWLREEIAWIAAAVTGGLPYWGVCLGMQLLATALGAPVFTGPWPEVGMHLVFKTKASCQDPIFREGTSLFWALQWHGETCLLPHGATLLATSPGYPVQAFRWGAQAYGLQYHLEATATWAAALCEDPRYRESLGPGQLSALVSAIAARRTYLCRAATATLKCWLTSPPVATGDRG